MTTQRVAHFIVFLTSDGYHEAGWRMHEFDGSDPIGLQSYIRSTAICERGLLDAAFFADRLALTPFRARAFPQTHHDPVQMLAALAVASSRVGLIATASTTFSNPWDLARRFATLDHISAGRIGWNVVTTYDPNAAENFGVPLPEHDDRYARATEFVEVVKRLWDSWEDGALIRDPAAGIWADPDRIHPAAFDGDYYSVAGALSVPRSPQGHPVLAQAGSSPAGIDLAGQTADVVFTPQRSVEAGIEFRQKIGAAAERHSRNVGDVRILPRIGVCAWQHRSRSPRATAASGGERRPHVPLADAGHKRRVGHQQDRPDPAAIGRGRSKRPAYELRQEHCRAGASDSATLRRARRLIHGTSRRT